jgi:RNA polymerase sigma-70 factor (ECF subfamily)
MNGANQPVYFDPRVSDSASNAAWCEPLYERKASALILYGRALGLSHAESQDVLQETFVALLKMRQEPEQPEHYCLRAFRNRAMNYHRSAWRRLLREWESISWFEPGSARDDAEAEAMRRLETLPPEQREVIVLKIWNHLTFDDIGELLDISPNTAAGRYRYGLQKLKVSLEDFFYARPGPIRKTIAIVDAPSSLA